MITKYKHLGYFFDKDDLKNIGHKSADEIVEYMMTHSDSFYKDDNPDEDTDFVPEEEYDECAIYTKDYKYIVVDKTLKKISPDWKDELKNEEIYIDIFEKYD